MWKQYSFKIKDEDQDHINYLAVIEHTHLHLLYAFKVQQRLRDGYYSIDCRFVEHLHNTINDIIFSDDLDDLDDLNDLMRLAMECLPRDLCKEITQSKATLLEFYKTVSDCIKGIFKQI